MNFEGMLAVSFAIGMGFEFIIDTVWDGVEKVGEMMDSNSSVVSDVNESIVDINSTMDFNSTIDANASMVVSVLNQLSSLV